MIKSLKNRKKKVLKHLGNTSMALILFNLMISLVFASNTDTSEVANQVITPERAKKSPKRSIKNGEKYTYSDDSYKYYIPCIYVHSLYCS